MQVCACMPRFLLVERSGGERTGIPNTDARVDYPYATRVKLLNTNTVWISHGPSVASTKI